MIETLPDKYTGLLMKLLEPYLLRQLDRESMEALIKTHLNRLSCEIVEFITARLNNTHEQS